MNTYQNKEKKSMCGAECDICQYGKDSNCKGCKKSNANPFGKPCFIANYISLGEENYDKFKKQIIKEFNDLNIPGMPKVKELSPLNGAFVNLEYPLVNGSTVKFLNDDEIYLGTQLECEFNEKEIARCFGLVASMNFLLVCEYGENGVNPEIILYKKR